MENVSNPTPILNQTDARPARGRAAPRLGAFVTIAASLLLLFGAASRVGKVPETIALFGIDNQAESRLRQDQERERTALVLGNLSQSRPDGRPAQGSVRLDPNPTPPARGLDASALQTPSGSGNGVDSILSLSIPQQVDQDGVGQNTGDYPTNLGAADRPEPTREDQTNRAARSYKVKKGDTWARIAKENLGDANRWRELMKANPKIKDGLLVGMELVIPAG